MSLPRYEKYKDSGVEWLWDVPCHWDVLPIRRISTTVQTGRTPESENPSTDVIEGLVWYTPGDFGTSLRLSDSARKISSASSVAGEVQLFPAGSVLIVGIGATLGKVGLATGLCSANQQINVVTPNPRIDSCFLAYSLVVKADVMRYLSNASTIGIMNQEKTKEIWLSVPPMSEQAAIATFLDHETSKIDALIAEQQRLIELLREKRQAVISHAVTKGLNPAAPMKPSGIEWLGDIPAHWSICPLKQAFRAVDYGISESLESDGAVAILRMGNISDGKVVMTDLKYVETVDPSLLLIAGDLLYNRTNSLELIGKVGMFEGAEIPVSFASYLVRLRTRTEYSSVYFSYLLNAPGLLAEARAHAIVAIGQCNLNPTRYCSLPVAIPPAHEQEQLSSHLARDTDRLDALTAEAQSAITLLQERRTALISAAVTGKIDVRSLASFPLP